MNLELGVPKNEKKLLELGKEVVQGVIDRFEDSYYEYVKVEDIKPETLILIGTKIYSDIELFSAHTRNMYEDCNFQWTNKVYDAFDNISYIVSDAITESGEYYFDKDAELYLLATYIDEVDSREKITQKIANVGKYNPLTIILDKDKAETIFIILSDNEQQYLVEEKLADGQFQTQHVNLDEDNLLNLAKEIENIINSYNNSFERFKLHLEQELNSLTDINSFDLPGVLSKDIEYKILRDYIVDVIAVAIKEKDDESIGHYELEYLWKKAEEHLDVFLNEGKLNTLEKEELDLIYSLSLDYKDEENVKQITTRYLREYFANILIGRNQKGNNLDLIALYHLLINDADKLEPYMEQLSKNNFSFENLNHDVMHLSFENPTIKAEVAEQLEELFNEYISVNNYTNKLNRLQNVLSKLMPSNS